MLEAAFSPGPTQQLARRPRSSKDTCAAGALLVLFFAWLHACDWAVYRRQPFGLIVRSCNARRGGAIFGCGNQQLSRGYIFAVTGERKLAIWRVAV